MSAPPIITESDRLRLWTKIECRTADECWPWRAGTCKDGYGKFQIGPSGAQRHLRAHRVALFLATGEWGDVTIHACDNPRCCNPAHLRWGTHQENRTDCAIKGRAARGDRNGARTKPESRRRGEEHPNSRLTAADVAQIRRDYVPKKNGKALAERFGIDLSNLVGIARGRIRRAG